MNIPKITFLTFGAGSDDYHDAVKRLCNQAKEMEIFSNIIGLTEEDLKKDLDFWNLHSEFIEKNKRGYGYWLWKPYIIHKTLKNMNDDELLIYLDCGCEFNKLAKNVLLSQIPLVNKKFILGTFAGSKDINFTKADLIHHFKLQDNIELLKINHMQAGALFMKKCNLIVGLYDKYYTIACNYHMIDDSPSIIKNHPSFIEHRHDQSIFNMLVKKLKLHNFDLLATNQGIDIRLPIWYARNRTGNSIK